MDRMGSRLRWWCLLAGCLMALAVAGWSGRAQGDLSTASAVGLQSTSDSDPTFEVLWEVSLQGWAHMMIIKDGVVYTQWTSGLLSAVDLYRGQVLAVATNVAFETAPFVIGDTIYSYNVGALHALNRYTLEETAVLPIPGGGYAENVPYDAETDCAFIWRANEFGEAQMSAVRISDGQDAWMSPVTFGQAEKNASSPLVPGDDSVYVLGADGTNRVWRLDKASGAVRWVTDIEPGDFADFNNMIYDHAHDVIYGATTNATCFAVRRTDGALLWKQRFVGFQVHSTLSYHAGQVYVPLFRAFYGPGANAALDAATGLPLWMEPSLYGSDGWSAMAVDDRYLYRGTHSAAGKIIIRDRFNGRLVWSVDTGYPQPCTNPVQSDGIVVFGNAANLIGLRVGRGLPVDCPWHGVNGTGYNPGAILWDDPAPDLDDDDDGLPDHWELGRFGHLFHSGNEDRDGDGRNAHEEYLAGTDDGDASDLLKLESLRDGRTLSFRFATRRASGLGYEGLERYYRIEAATDLLNPIWQPIPEAARIKGDGKPFNLSLEMTTLARMYRVAVWLEPK